MLEIGKSYRAQELTTLLTQERAQELQAQGVIIQFDTMLGTFKLVPHTEALSEDISGTPKTGTGGFAPLDPIKKRTPQERLDSLMLRFIEDCKMAGTVPGLDDARISLILGEAWRSGRSEVTAEVVREVARSFLEKAEAEKVHADYKRTAKPSPND